jgi:hypothetical protein
MHLLKPKCQEKGLQKLLCTSDVLQMGAPILYPPSFKPPRPPNPLIQMLEGWLLKKTSKTLNPEIYTEGSETENPACRLLFFSNMQLLNKNFPIFVAVSCKSYISYRLLHSNQHAHR